MLLDRNTYLPESTRFFNLFRLPNTFNRESWGEEALDGIYVIRTSLSSDKLTSQAAVAAYKQLSLVEQAFRCFRSIDLKIRPIYHRPERRVRAHVFLCMLAYYVEWHMRQLLAPVLFDDDDPQGAQGSRSSVCNCSCTKIGFRKGQGPAET